LSRALELAFTERFITMDILNNSAWSHRFFILFGHGRRPSDVLDDEVYDREVEYAKDIIRLLSSNPAPWNYLRGYTILAKILILGS
jgi:protein farnesyltransferase/geranylgeranyltransferase type-1 subunit alpha